MIKHTSYLVLILLIFAAATIAVGQTTEFTYQGRLLDNSLPPTASYDFEFRLFDAEVSGNELGSDSQLGVAVNAGVFSVRLDFGTQFDGTPRFLQIGVRPAGSPEPYTILDPRQPISSTPYAIRSLNAAAAETADNAAQLGGVDAAEYVQDDDERLTNERAPAPGSGNYIQNQTAGTQPLANFDISGTGKAGAIDSSGGYRMNGDLVFHVSTASQGTFAGSGAGSVNTGFFNSFFGKDAGTANTSGSANSFFGSNAGLFTTTGSENSFFGQSAGQETSDGGANSFFGSQAGRRNQTGEFNSFFGRGAGEFNTTGSNNTAVGSAAGQRNAAGQKNVYVGSFAGFNAAADENAFVGAISGSQTTTGSRNAFFGYGSGQANVEGARNTFIGASAGAGNTSGWSNVFVGDNAGLANTTASQNSFLGFSAGFNNQTGTNNAFVGQRAGLGNTIGNNNTFLGQLAGSQNTTGSNNMALGSGSGFSTGSLTFATAIGPGTIVSSNNTIQLGRITQEERVLVPGDLQVNGALIADLPGGSGSYIQNTTTTQSSSNFNISGTGTANIFMAGTQYNIGGSRILSSPGTLNTFVGINNGPAITSGERNTFVGRNTGVNTTTGSTNTFVGSGAGFDNISGSQNSFFGYNAGLRVTGGSRNSYFGVSVGGANLIGVDNAMFGYESGLNATGSGSSFFGYQAGRHTTSAADNSFFGRRAGMENTAGGYNVFLGALTGEFNTVGNFNTFVGAFAGNGNLSGTNNTVLGYGANVGSVDLQYATAIGAGSVVPTSNTIQLGRSDGADRVTVPGDLNADSILSDDLIAINSNNGISLSSTGGTGFSANISIHSGNVIYLEGNYVDLLPGTRFRLRTMTAGTSGAICANGDGFFGWCGTSSIRYKKNVTDFTSAFSIIDRLRPVTFDWISNDKNDIGLVAEEVAAVEPLLAIYNEDGEVQGVKYDRIGVVLINVVKEQQEQIEAQRKRIEEQEAQIRAMRSMLCELMPGAKLCAN